MDGRTDGGPVTGKPPPEALRGAWQGGISALEDGEQASRGCAPGIWAYLPSHPALSFSDSFLCSYALLILSHRFPPDPVGSLETDTLPHAEVFPAPSQLASRRDR